MLRCFNFVALKGCDTNPCVYASSCTNGVGMTYTCTCYPGYSGTNCELGTQHLFTFSVFFIGTLLMYILIKSFTFGLSDY